MESILKLSLFERLKLNGRIVLIKKISVGKIREVIQKKQDNYERWYLPINGDKSGAVLQNSYLTEEDVKHYLENR